MHSISLINSLVEYILYSILFSFKQLHVFQLCSIHVLEVVLVFLSISPYVCVKDMVLIVQMSLAFHLDGIILH